MIFADALADEEARQTTLRAEKEALVALVQEEIARQADTLPPSASGAPMPHVLEVRSKVGGKREALLRAFRALDADNSGKAGEARALRVLGMCGLQQVTPAELRHLFRFVDADAQGRIDYEAFVRAMGVGQDAQETMDAKLRQKCAAMLKVLAGADAQGRGLLTVPQMRAALRHNPPALRLYLDHEEIERVLGEAARQVGNTHSIDYHEFVRRVVGARAAPWFLQGRSHRSSMHLILAGADLGELEPNGDHLHRQAAFLNADGTLAERKRHVLPASAGDNERPLAKRPPSAPPPARGAAIRGLLATPAHKLTAAQKLKLDEVLNVGPMPLGYPAGGQKSTGSGAPRRGRASLPSLASTSTLRAAKAWRPAGYS
jgi:hypothetical protein